MNGYQLIMKLQQKMQDPYFAERFNVLVAELNNIPGLQSKVMELMQIENEKKREKAIDKLPSKAKTIVKELLELIKD